MTPLQSKFTAYGVLNLTPNSFSDGGHYSEFETLKKTLNEWQAWGVSFFDLGAESTAPSNDPISVDHEWERIEKLGLPLISEFPAGSVVSLDTYRPETFQRFYNEVSARRKDLSLIFNDVSGVLDEGLWETLEKCPEARYIYSHTYIPERSQTSFHMDFVNKDLAEEQFLEDFVQDMQKALSAFSRKNLAERVILDPCFGFSKTHEQNLALLRQLPQIWMRFVKQEITNDWLVGISKKSFLQKAQPQSLDSQSKMMSAEYLHLLHLWRLLQGWGESSQSKQKLYFRLHNPAIVYNMKTFLEFGGHEANS